MCTYHYIDPTVDTKTISIGVPMPSYQCLILDKFLPSVAIDQEGELLMSGVGVFAGYLGRDDLTEKALIEISGKVYYRTGDLVRMDYNGLLHYQGRKDHQIKLHGQRIELGEIERCLLNTSISACVVMKWGDDHLVAYVQSSEMNEEQLRQHCQSQLPPHMIPSIFMVLEKLPLNANGKIDRKLLPSPNISHFSHYMQEIMSNYQLQRMKSKLPFIRFGVILFSKIESQSIQIFSLSVVIHYFSCNSFIDIEISFTYKQILFRWLISFNIRPLPTMLNSSVRSSMMLRAMLNSLGHLSTLLRVRKTPF